MWDTSKWRSRIKKRLSLIAIGALLAGFGMNVTLAFAPNVIPPLITEILIFFGIGITIIGIVLFSVSLFRKLPEELLTTPEAYQKVDLACHIWSGDFILYPEHKLKLTEAKITKYSDIWEWMKPQIHPYSADAWKKYLPLFTNSINGVNNKLLETIKLFPGSI
jgi:hypothetical protein